MSNEVKWSISGLDASKTEIENKEGKYTVSYVSTVSNENEFIFTTQIGDESVKYALKLTAVPVVTEVNNEQPSTPTTVTEEEKPTTPTTENEEVVVPPVVVVEPEPINEPEPIIPVEEEEIPVTPAEPVNDYIIWIKDSLWGRDFEITPDEWTWTRPTEHAYDVYIEGPQGTEIYPEIERAGKIYTTKEELTSRGPRIGFNKLQNIPMTLQGVGTKTLIGKGIGPGSASAKGYKGTLRFKNEKGEIIKEILMQFI